MNGGRRVWHVGGYVRSCGGMRRKESEAGNVSHSTHHEEREKAQSKPKSTHEYSQGEGGRKKLND